MDSTLRGVSGGLNVTLKRSLCAGPGSRTEAPPHADLEKEPRPKVTLAMAPPAGRRSALGLTTRFVSFYDF